MDAPSPRALTDTLTPDWYPILIIITILVILMTIYHDKIVHWLTPATNWMKEWVVVTPR